MNLFINFLTANGVSAAFCVFEKYISMSLILALIPFFALAVAFLRPILRWCTRKIRTKKEKDVLDLPGYGLSAISVAGSSVHIRNRQHRQSSVGSWASTNPPAVHKGAPVGTADLAAGVEMLHPNFRKIIGKYADPIPVAPAPLLMPAQEHRKQHISEEARVPLHRGSQFELDYNDIEFKTLIGEGAFGRVYYALWKGTEVAAKVLICNNLSDSLLEEFRNEISVMSSLRHPNICMFIGAISTKNPCIVTEYCRNGSLWTVLHEQSQAIDWAMLLHLIRGIALGFTYLHANKPRPILHRDLKSGNVLISADWNPKIADFGMSRLQSHTQTMTGQCGTMAWMAPEVLAQQRYTEKADVYSFAICVWEMEMSRLKRPSVPYGNINQVQAAVRVLQHNARPIFPAGAAPPVVELAHRCWNKDPSRRPSFAEILKFPMMMIQ